MRGIPVSPLAGRTGRRRIVQGELKEVTVGNVTDDAADRAEALCGELQRLLVGLGIMPAAPKLRRRHWLLAAGVLAGLAAVVTVIVTREKPTS